MNRINTQIHTKELTALTLSIASALGSDWYVNMDDDNWSRRIRNQHSKNIVLYVSGDGYNKPTKVNISGSLMIGENGQYVQVYETAADGSGWHKADPGSISVTIARGAEVIAKEIKRRFLPEYLRILALAEEQVRKETEYKDTKRENAIRLAVASGSDFRPDPKDERVDFHVKLGGLSTEFHINGNSTVDIKVDDLTLDKAEKLIAYLRKL